MWKRRDAGQWELACLWVRGGGSASLGFGWQLTLGEWHSGHRGFPHSGIQRKVMVCAAGFPAAWILFLCGAEHTLTHNTATAVDIRQALICSLVFCGEKKAWAQISPVGCGSILWNARGKSLPAGRGYSSFKLSIFREGTSYKSTTQPWFRASKTALCIGMWCN